MVGDVLRIPGETVKATTGAAVTAGATLLPVAPAFPVQAGETINILDPQVVTYTTGALAAGATTVNLVSTAGLAPGQMVSICDVAQICNVYTIATVPNATSITLTGGVAVAVGAGAEVWRNALGLNVTVQASTTTSPITVTVGLASAFSATAQVSVSRASENVTVTAIAGDNLTVTRATPAFHRSGSQIALLSEPEVRQVQSNGVITSGDRLLLLNTPLNFMHRLGAAVTKQPQGVMTLTAMPTGVAIGDTVVIDTLSPVNFPNTRADRFDATVVAVDTANNQVTVTANTARARVDYSTADVWFMGDAAVVSGAVDSNGNTLRSTSDNRVNLSNGLTK
jgi:hypothetical protein